MATLAPPVRRGDFYYSSLLYADPGNDFGHPRASVAHLASLLRPEAPTLYTNGRNPTVSTPAKDPPWHFYTSQLIHYGLPVTRNKNGAKMRLLTAMNQFKLEGPAWVLQLEADLKKEWDADVKKLKNVGTVSGTVGQAGTKGKGKGAQIVDGGVNFTVNVSVCSGFSVAEQAGMQQSMSTPPEKPSPTKRKRTDNDTPTKAFQAKIESTPTKRIKQEYNHSSPSSTPSRSRARQDYGSPLPQRPPYPLSPYINTTSYPHTGANECILLSGIYEVTCPTASELFGDYDLELTLVFDSTRDIWWATFRWGTWDGIIQLNPGPSYNGIGQPCTLGWRMRDLETGKLKFGKKCTGTMTFFEDQTLLGVLREVPGAGKVEFEGTRLPGLALEGDLQYAWDAFVAEAYGR